jgi:hypothetical protein
LKTENFSIILFLKANASLWGEESIKNPKRNFSVEDESDEDDEDIESFFKMEDEQEIINESLNIKENEPSHKKIKL